jgi:peptidoglycan/LPS O-acetylase OafA/YrhL
MSTKTTAKANTTKSARLDSIDALRGLAALSVALYHIWGKDGIYPWPSIGIVTQTFNPTAFHYLISPLRWGYLGVSLFLVLSGFCIHLAYAQKKHDTGSYQFTHKEFFLRRIWRLYPAYLLAIFGTFLLLNVGAAIPQIGLSAHLPIPGLRDLFTHTFMLHGFDEQSFYSIASVFWSLTLEFQLYLAYPLFLKLFDRLGINRSMILLIGLSLVWRVFAIFVMDNGLISVATFGPFTAMGSVLARMPEWLMGAYVAHLFVTGKLKNFAVSKSLFAFGGLMALGIASSFSEAAWVLTDPIFGLAFASLTVAFMNREQLFQSSAPLRRLVWIGTISYSLYLFHLQLFWLIAPFVDRIASLEARTILRLLWLAVSVLVCAQLYKFVEKPFLRLPKAGMRFHSAFSILQKSLGIKSDKEATVALSKSGD